MKFVTVSRYLKNMPKKSVLGALACYRATRFLRRPSCRFYPSCSQYMAGCVEHHGVGKGLLLGLLRLVKCHPWHPGGVDEVPVGDSRIYLPAGTQTAE